MLPDIRNDAETQMQKRLEILRSELVKIRTGRANPSLLEHILVPYYGNDTPLNQVASITVSDARTLSISPWEKNLIPAIEKAIMQSGLGLNPASVGNVIRVPMPILTEERRKEMIKLVRQMAEDARVSIRNIRRDANAKIKTLSKDKKISEDEERRGETDIQKLTDRYINDIDQLLSKKETDLMEI
jgi:ribosome recycling factor